jgi:hypothetical protein
MLFASFAASTALAQDFSVGVVAGAGLTDGFQDHIFQGVDTQTHFFSDSKDFIIGPMAEVGFPLGVSVELDALYRPLHLSDSAVGIPLGTFHSSTTVGTWQFPLLLKYRFPTFVPVVKPFVEVGPSFRAGSGADASPSSHGITLGGGVEVKVIKVKVAPQLRFTRWGSDGAAKIFATPQTNVNQAEFLVGLSF